MLVVLFPNIISSGNLIFSINFEINNKKYDFYVKIGKYDYGNYDKSLYGVSDESYCVIL